jgi:protein involved in plasmid replication-relaxation
MNGNKRIGLVIQERDRRLLRKLGHLRVIDREQAKVIGGFSSTTRVNTRLLSLTRAGLLKRFFLGTRAGGAKALYSLSPKGATFVGVPDRGPQRRKDTALVGDLFVEHQLAVNDIYCAFQTHTMPGVAFRRWVAFFEPIAQGVRLIPDGYVELETPSGIAAAFLELDLGSESRTVWKDKVKTYLTYAVSGAFEKQFGLTRFRVLVVAHSERRMQSIRRVVAETTDRIFWFASLESIHRDGLFSPVWLRPKGEDRLPLIKEPL